MNCLISGLLRKFISLSNIKFLMINLALGMPVEENVLMEKEFTQLFMVIFNDAARNSACYRVKIVALAKTLLTVCSLNQWVNHWIHIFKPTDTFENMAWDSCTLALVKSCYKLV